MSLRLLDQTYVLRLWQEQAASTDHPAIWRFMLTDPRTGQRRGFDEIESLISFLQTQIEANNK